MGELDARLYADAGIARSGMRATRDAMRAASSGPHTSEMHPATRPK
jgi:hypothetical protein